ncbi:ABC transporter substrate-binding protein [Paenibacillus sp. GCM10027626]|uniref:ABC transporter substrate-binding protein n=1 Tax=Paenibacillus sp. GCM10027626 TaxID=3273411 RepID=UPI0036436FE1
MSRRKYVVVLLGAFTICMILTLPMLVKPGTTVVTFGGEAGMQPGPDTTSSYGAVSKLQVALSVSDDEFQYWTEKNEQFLGRNPGIKVELLNISPEDARQAWLHDFQIGAASDILLMDNIMIRPFTVAGYLTPLDDLFSGEMLNDHLEALTAPLKWNGYIWGVPVDCDPHLIVWQRQLLESAGFDAPPSDWQAFKSLIAKLTASAPSLQMLTLPSGEEPFILTWMESVPSKGTASDMANLGEIKGQAAEQLHFLAQQSGRVREKREEGGDWLERMANGEQLAAVVSWSDYRALSAEERKLLVVSDKAAPPVWGEGRSFAVAAQTAHGELAKKWLQAMTSTEQQKEQYTSLGKLPVRKSLYSRVFQLYDERYSSPPSWLIPMLDQIIAEPDPGWSLRWERWSALWRQIDLQQLDAAAADHLIERWNEPFASQADG